MKLTRIKLNIGTMIKQEETIEMMKSRQEESEIEWKKRCKTMGNRANQDMERLKSTMESKFEKNRELYRKEMRRLTRKFEEKQRK